MKYLILLVLFARMAIALNAQSDSVHTYIFVPHPRNEDNVHQSVIKAIEQINFSKFELILLGGDLTYTTSKNRISMSYCDSLFGLRKTTTLWTLGNHDLTNKSLIAEYTGKPTYYSLYYNNITFVVLNTELNANGFTSSHIQGEQFDFLKHTCDTLKNSRYLVVLHHRLLWMVGNTYFDTLIDSVAESTRQLDTSNFNAVVLPLLQQVKHKGIRVLCLGGDKSKVNIEYTPEDSITYIAATMAPEYTNAVNNVVILEYNDNTSQLTWHFQTLDSIEKNAAVVGVSKLQHTDNKIHINVFGKLLYIRSNAKHQQRHILEIFNSSGQLIYNEQINAFETKEILLSNAGVYFLKDVDKTDASVMYQKVLIQ